MLTLYILGYIFMHLMIGGFAFQKVQAIGKPKCQYRNSSNCDSACGHSVLAGFSIIIWPIVLPVAIGAGGSQAVKTNLGSRTERRREKEIDEANHRVRLAQIRAQETEALEKALEAK